MKVALAVLLALRATAAFAQVPPDLAERSRTAGQTMDPTSAAGYAALFPPSAWDGVNIERDIAYGPDPLHKLDVYTTRGDSGPRTVILFVHGGGFTRGDKHGAFYPDNIPMWAARQGMIGVSINYRLAPVHPYPAAGQDLREALSWVDQNISRYGGDPRRVILFGHSSGAGLVADLATTTDLAWLDGPSFLGKVLLSPSYPAYPGDSPNVYYSTAPSLNSKESIVERLNRFEGTPIFLADAEFDPPLMRETAQALRDGLCSGRAGCPTYIHLKDHNHFTEGMSLGTDDQSLAGPLLEWIASLTGERG